MDSLDDVKKWAWDAKVEWVRTGQHTIMNVATPIELAHWIELLIEANWPITIREQEKSVQVVLEFLIMEYERE